jgi:hypothetical protein
LYLGSEGWIVREDDKRITHTALICYVAPVLGATSLRHNEKLRNKKQAANAKMGDNIKNYK